MRVVRALAPVLALTACGGGDDDASTAPLDPATLCMSSSCGTKTALLKFRMPRT